MSRDPYYRTPGWRLLREFVVRRAHGRCETPGCGSDGVVVDHVRARRDGGQDTPANLRLLCRRCDNAVKERADGKRRSAGKLSVPGCDAKGRPRDPRHWWNR